MISPATLPSLTECQNKVANNRRIGRGRVYMGLVAIANTLFAVFLLLLGMDGNQPALIGGVVQGFTAMIFWALWFWANYAPFPAALSALVVYVGVVLSYALYSPGSLLNAIIFKLFIIIGLAKAASSAWHVRRRSS